MKQLIAILLFVIAGITTFSPCCNGEDDGVAIHTTAASGHVPDEGDESCSPFSSCIACCFGFTLQVHTVSLPEPSISGPQHYSPEGVPLLPEPSFSFWQPPKAGASPC